MTEAKGETEAMVAMEATEAMVETVETLVMEFLLATMSWKTSLPIIARETLPNPPVG